MDGTAAALIGQVIRGYEIVERIGRGGFGEVYRALQPAIGREVAIKVIVPKYANHPEFIRRFEIEAQLIAQLEHPHIVPLYDYWREPEGAFLVMRWLRGGSLRQTLDTRVFDLHQATRIVEQLAAALTIAHRNDVVHRDLKPANIMFDEDLNAYLTDFGIAKILNVNSNLTHENALMGSIAYLSPEQIQGGAVTPQADIYSLGIILYEMLTGRHPFGDIGLSEMLQHHLHEAMPSVQTHNPNLPISLDTIIERAAAKVSRDRYNDALEMAAELNDVLLGIFDGRNQRPRTSRYDIMQRVGLSDAENPYKGLQPLQEADAPNMFGRHRLVEHLLSRLQTGAGNLLVLVGPSGCGKSSVVRAGLLPALRKGGLPGSDAWYILPLLPGTHPLEELEAALVRVSPTPIPGLLEALKADSTALLGTVQAALPVAGGRLVLFIDQFEELFTLADAAEREQFMALLIHALTTQQAVLTVIVAIRADYYDKPLQYVELAELVQQNTEFVLPMTSEDLRDAIAGPAMRVGVRVEKGLAEIILQDIRNQPGALPLLQYALRELFERREGNAITLESYREIGGVLGALARRAEQIYSEFTPEEQQATRRLFVRLLSMDDDAYDGVVRVTLPELLIDVTERAVMQHIIDVFAKYRLLTFDRDPVTRIPTVAVAHELLVFRWGRLQDWLNASRAMLRIHRQVVAAATDWEAHARADAYLLFGPRIEAAQRLLNDPFLMLDRSELAYIQASVEHEKRRALTDSVQADKTAQLKRQVAQRTRQLQALAALCVVLLVVVTALLLAQGGQSAQAGRVQGDLQSAQQQIEALNSRLATLEAQPNTR